MKKRKKTLWVLGLLLLCNACSASQQEEAPAQVAAAFSWPLTQLAATTDDAWEAVLASYYAAQEEPAFAYIQKNRICRFMTEHWTPTALGEVQNQQWHFDSFTKYAVLDQDGAVISHDLYCCTFSADNGQYGFIVVKYFDEYPAVQNQGVVETEYLYDLQMLAEQIVGALRKAGVDLSSATATRARWGADEIILFADGESRYACDLASFEIVKL